MVSPLSMALSTMCAARFAYSAGRPSREGCGTWRPRESCASWGSPAIMGVSKIPGAMVTTRISERASSRAIGSVMAATAPLEAA